jgi:urease subunit alpha
MPFEIDRALHTRMYGPTVGDQLRLADTNLIFEVERDYAGYGDETLWGFGKTIRDGLQMRSRPESEPELHARDDRFGKTILSTRIC